MFYGRLKHICTVKGVDITPFIVSLGMSPGNISKWKNGSEPRNSTKKKIADALGVDVSVFVEKKISTQNENERDILSKYVFIGDLCEKDRKEIIAIVEMKRKDL